MLKRTFSSYPAILVAMLAVVPPALAATAPSTVVVVGHGSVDAAPDVATLSFKVRGEGQTSDAAAAALVRVRDAVFAGIGDFLGTQPEPTFSNLTIEEVRDEACYGDNDQDRARLSTGACAIRGYVASADVTLSIAASKSGTALGLAARLGASSPRISGFALARPDAARRLAISAAMRDGTQRAVAIALASGGRLGALISVADQIAGPEGSTNDIVVTAQRAPSPPAVMPIAIELKPDAITTTAALVITYAIAP